MSPKRQPNHGTGLGTKYGTKHICDALYHLVECVGCHEHIWHAADNDLPPQCDDCNERVVKPSLSDKRYHGGRRVVRDSKTLQ